MKNPKKSPEKISPESDKYLQNIYREINQIKMIPAEEDDELFKLIQQGDEQAIERVAKANLRFVVSIAQQYQNKGLSLDELIKAGTKGLREAIKKGNRMVSLAPWWIRPSIEKAIKEKNS